MVLKRKMVLKRRFEKKGKQAKILMNKQTILRNRIIKLLGDRNKIIKQVKKMR